MAELVGYDHQRRTVCNHQAGVCVPQGMDRHLRQAGALHEVGEPVRHGVRKKRFALLCGEDAPIGITPGIPQQLPLGVLPLLILQEEQDGRARDPQRSLAGGRLRGVGIAALCRQIVPRLPDVEKLLIQIHVRPAQAQELCPAQAGEQVKGDHRPPKDLLLLKQLQQTAGVRLIQISCLPVGDAG